MRLLLCLVLLAGCDPQSAGEVAILPGLADYRSDGYVRVNRAPYTSELDRDIAIDVWISSEAVADYARIAPEADGSLVSLPEGTVIIREVHEAQSGQLGKLTLMIKGPPGYAPEVGDWWFAVTDERGVPLDDASGKRMAGALHECYGCHQGRQEDDFLFGVPGFARP
jgi:hypothetical protein